MVDTRLEWTMCCLSLLCGTLKMSFNDSLNVDNSIRGSSCGMLEPRTDIHSSHSPWTDDDVDDWIALHCLGLSTYLVTEEDFATLLTNCHRKN